MRGNVSFASFVPSLFILLHSRALIPSDAMIRVATDARYLAIVHERDRERLFDEYRVRKKQKVKEAKRAKLQENCAKFAQYLQVDEWKTLKN
jgi:hypothetical protein